MNVTKHTPDSTIARRLQCTVGAGHRGSRYTELTGHIAHITGRRVPGGNVQARTTPPITWFLI